MQQFLKMIGAQNLLLIALAEVALKYLFIEQFPVFIILGHFDFALLCLASLSIAAGAQIFNYSKLFPQNITINKAQNYFVTLNMLGVGIAFYLSNSLGKPIYSSLFILGSGFAFFYGNSLRHYAVLGNLLLAFLAVLPIFVVAIYDLMPVMTEKTRSVQLRYFSILVDYALFVFSISWLRQMARDQLHINRDYELGITTLPIVLGRKRSKMLMIALLVILIAAFLWYSFTYFSLNESVLIFNLVCIGLPLLLALIFAVKAENSVYFKLLFHLFYLILIATVLSLSFYQFAFQ